MLVWSDKLQALYKVNRHMNTPYLSNMKTLKTVTPHLSIEFVIKKGPLALMKGKWLQ